jgi:alkanesulfonate monooxygenase SsuD/methylene tetrahydromethanopterin reductase-like flavin-dependent oxidoreductase (luciferase family)
LRNLWITADPAERAAVLDWQRASYVLYQGLGWTVAESDAGAAIDFAADAERAIETAVATTIIGSVEEVIDGLRAVAAAGVDDVVLRIAIEGAPQQAIHEVMRTFADGVFPELADEDARTVPCASV